MLKVKRQFWIENISLILMLEIEFALLLCKAMPWAIGILIAWCILTAAIYILKFRGKWYRNRRRHRKWYEVAANAALLFIIIFCTGPGAQGANRYAWLSMPLGLL